MTEAELEKLWPCILRASRSALHRYGARGFANSPADVAIEVALTLSAYPRVTPAMIAKVARCKAADFYRWATHHRSKDSVPMVNLERLPESGHHIDITDDRGPVEMKQKLGNLTRRQRQLVAVMWLCQGSIEDTAKAMKITRGTVDKHLHDLRVRMGTIKQAQEGPAPGH